MEKIFILLPVFNRKQVTYKFIQCLQQQTYTNYHLVVIDDGSTDGTAEMIRSKIPLATIIRGKGNWWWAGSLQQGYKWLNNNKVNDSDIVLIINDDTEFESDFLEKARKLLHENQRSLILSHCYSQQTKALLDSGVHIDWKYWRFEQSKTPNEINCLSTRGLFMTTADLKFIGGFHPLILPHYLSDYEFTIRAQHKGLKLITNSILKIWVDETTTGYHDFRELSFFDYINIYFSKKSASNPIYFSVFIVLACPWQWKILNLIRVWKGAIAGIINKIVHKS